MTDPIEIQTQVPTAEPYLRRGMEAPLREALSDTPVVCLLGPRQCGKSTLAAHLAPERAYITLDDSAYPEAARADPQGFVNSLPERVTIDEIQRVPELTLALKRSVDLNRAPGRFLLTGSLSETHLQRLSSLAFSWGYLRICPVFWIGVGNRRGLGFGGGLMGPAGAL